MRLGNTTVIFDADDVMFNFRTAAERVLLLDMDYVTDPAAHIFFPEKEAKTRFAEIIDSRPGWVYGLDIYPGIVETLALLREMEVDTVVATRPFKRSKNWYNERSAALVERLGFKHEDLYFCGNKSRIMGDILVDDDPKHCRMWQLTHPEGTAVLWDSLQTRDEALHHQSVRTREVDHVITLARAFQCYYEAAR